MPNSVHVIPRNRLSWIPGNLRFAYKNCISLHDESMRLLVEYEAAVAQLVKFESRDNADARILTSLQANKPLLRRCVP
jgi:hypothetical protein